MNQIPSHIYHIEGREQGPSFLILGGTHGDERIGIEVIKLLMQEFGLSEQKRHVLSDRITGNLYIGFGNPEAIMRHARAASEGADLNRVFTKQILEDHGATHSLDEQRARELASFLAQMNYVIDVHGTSAPSPRFICFYDNPRRHEILCQPLNAEFIITDPYNILARDVGKDEHPTLVRYVDQCGGIGIAYEAGWDQDTQNAPLIVEELKRVLIHVGMLHDMIDTNMKRHMPVYALTDCIKAEDALFTYETGMDHGIKEVSEGDVVGRYGNGELACIPPLKSQALYLFQRDAKRIQKGHALYYLATREE